MKDLTERLLAILFWIIIAWLTGSFVEWSLNPANWSVGITLILLGFVIFAGYSVMNKNNYDDR